MIESQPQRALFIPETCEFVGRKLRRVRWQTPSNNLHVPDKVAGGSWDDENNEVSIWRVVHAGKTDADRSSTMILGKEDAVKLVKSASFPLFAATEDLKFLSNDHLLVSTSTGDVHYLAYSETRDEIQEKCVLQRLHEGACTAVSLLSDCSIVSVGTEGHLQVTDLNSAKMLLRIGEEAFQCNDGFSSMQVISAGLVITGNYMGQIQVWDLRVRTNKAQTVDTARHGSVLSMCYNPSQPHVLACGTACGAVDFYDLRQDLCVTSSLSLHKSFVWEVKFHPTYPANLFTASNDQTLLHVSTSFLQDKKLSSQVSNPWLLPDLELKIRTVPLLPFNVMSVNSVDVVFNSLVCCTDNESLWILKHPLIC
ncbi:unnamed protein product [Soboliphyme baturini]|uniref:WD_REPEATS_REGION domain-containing protein n=1 Tax=Soboliphyme baturini TaxID=241478 RepID=A0A183IPJ7_9BILA|nr:unnamed protein product [Soboliphyme baturini]